MDATAVLVTAEDDKDELDIRFSDLDPTGELRKVAGDRLIVLPMENLGGAFPLVQMRAGEAGPSSKWRALATALSELPRLRLLVFDTLNAHLHGDENSATVVADFFRIMGPVLSGLKVASIITHHVRKAGPIPVRNADEMRAAIRGSSALIGNIPRRDRSVGSSRLR
ncbi:MAG: AAA family ATPase [Pseudomonadota bacterium]